MDPLPIYNTTPQTTLDCLLTRIYAPLLRSLPNARFLLEQFVDSQRAPNYDALNYSPQQGSRKAMDRYPSPADDTLGVGQDHNLLLVQQAIVDELYNAVKREDRTSIDHLINHNLVTANVTSRDCETPLLVAIKTKNIEMVQQLLELGADPNMFGQIFLEHEEDGRIELTRTPLMLAATLGSLPIVRLLLEAHSADHTLIAPDGQIALRLAVEHHQQPIVDLLPSFRAGGLLRFRTRNARNIARAKRALCRIYEVFRLFLWDLPKFFLWSVPKHVVMLPSIRFGKWAWANRKRFGSWCKRQAIEIPKKVWRGIKKFPDKLFQAWKAILKGLKKLGPMLWYVVKSTLTSIINFIKALPETVINVVQTLWNFFTLTLPQWLKNLATWLWDLAKRIPKAIQTVLEWLWDVIKSSAKATWEILTSIMSFFHTVLIAIITFLRNVTLRDIWIAFCQILRSVFINIPKTLWSCLKGLSTVLYNVMDALFGCFGRLIWHLGATLFRVFIYVPKKLWIILESVGDSIGHGAYEIKVWISPKS